METVIYLDTHVALWLYADGATTVPNNIITQLNQEDDIRISPMACLELNYLKEIQRINVEPGTILNSLGSSIGLSVCNTPFHTIIKEAIANTWTRDPFDRIIVGNAKAHNAELVTKDESIRANYSLAIWG